jgi:hypothetical protein
MTEMFETKKNVFVCVHLEELILLHMLTTLLIDEINLYHQSLTKKKFGIGPQIMPTRP